MHPRRELSAVFFAFLMIAGLSGAIVAQSGRGRPRVPVPEPAAPAPPPVMVPRSTAVVAREQVGNISRFVLQNGMTVIVSEQHASPLAAIVAAFKTGRSNEPDSEQSVRRLLGALLCRVASARPTDHAQPDTGPLGAAMRAISTYDATYFSTVVQSDKVKDALAREAAVIQRPSFSSADAAREGRLLIAEDNRLHDDPPTYGLSRLFDVAFAKGRSPDTSDRSWQFERDRIADYYTRHFTPKNLIIAVVGDVATFDTLVEIQRQYASFGQAKEPEGAEGEPSGAAASNARPPIQAAKRNPSEQEASKSAARQAEPEPPNLAYHEERGDIEQSIVTAGYPVPDVSGDEWAAFEVLAAILGRGRGSVLNRKLLIEQGLVGRVQSDYTAAGDTGLLSIQMWIAPTAIDKAEAALFKEIARLRQEAPQESDVARAKAMLEKHLVDEVATYADRALTLARYAASGRDLAWYSGRLDRVKAVRSEDLQRAAARYLTLGNTLVHEYEPFSAAPRTFAAGSYAATVQAWAPEMAMPQTLGATEGPMNQAPQPPGPKKTAGPAGPKPGTQPVKETAIEERARLESLQPLPVRDFSTLNGPRAFVREDHSQPLVTVALLFEGGRISEDDSNTGITELMVRTMLYGTARLTPEDAARELEQFGAEAELVAEPDFYGFVLRAPSPRAGAAIKTLRDLMENPAFREDDVERARIEQLGLIRRARDFDCSHSRELLFQALFPGHPYALPASGRQDSLAKLKSDQLRDWYNKGIKLQFPLVVIVGDTDGSALVSEGIAEAFKRRDLAATFQVKLPRGQAIGERVEQRRRRQSSFCVGFPGPKADSADQPIIEVIESIMNGPGGRFADEMEKQAIAGRATLAYEPMLTGSAVYACGDALPESEARARAAIVAGLGRLAIAAPNPDEVSIARSQALLRRAELLQSQRETALEYARAIFFKRKASDVDSYADRLAKITLDDVKRVTAAYFKAATSAGIIRATSQTAAASPAKEN